MNNCKDMHTAKTSNVINNHNHHHR